MVCSESSLFAQTYLFQQTFYSNRKKMLRDAFNVMSANTANEIKIYVHVHVL